MSQKNPKSPKSPGNALEVIGKAGGIKLDDIDLQQLTAISAPIKKRINALKNEQVKLLELEKKFFEELHELESKYVKLYEPIYEKRRKIVIGEVEPTEDEAKWALDEADEEEKKGGEGEANGEKPKEDKPAIDESKLTDSAKKLLGDLKAQFDSKKGGDEKGIPNFWLETLQAFRITAEMIQEHDEPVLAFLQDIRVRMHDKKPYGYTLEFEFAENPYFTNKVLTKTFDLKIDVDPTDPFSFEGPDLERCTGCKIDWKPNKNVTVRLIKKKIKGRNKKAPAKTITKEEKQESFFTFFETRPEAGKAAGKSGKPRQTSESGASDSGKQVALKKNHPDDEDEDEDEIDEETAHDLYLMTEYETGQYIKDKIIPKAVLYFSGELDEMDDEDYDDGEDYDEDDEDLDDEDEDDDDEDDDDDDDDDDEDDHPKGGKKGGPGGKGGKKGGKPGHHHHHKGEGGSGKPGEPTPSECKQN